jgi:hypothetical protein
MSDKDMIIELLGIAEVAEDGTVDFTDRAKEIIMDLAEKYRKTPIYEQAKKETPEWVNTATAAVGKTESLLNQMGEILES